MKSTFGILALIAFIITFQSCTAPTKPSQEVIVIDTTQYQKVDSVADIHYKVLKDTVLTIKADSVKALYYPNTGKVVMTLKKGDKCNITRTGRYDVVDNKGNFWIRVERMGGKGWVWGGATSIESDLWVFGEGMTEMNHPYMTYQINNLSSSDFEGLFALTAKSIKAVESSEDIGEGESFKVDVNSYEITTTDDNGLGTVVKEKFNRGPSRDSVQSINYFYQSEENNPVTFNHAFISYQHGSKNSLVLDFIGELKSIYRAGSNYIFISDYNLTGGELGKIHFANITVWNAKKKVIKRQRLGYSAIEPTGLPIFKSLEDHSFIVLAECRLIQKGDALSAEVFETYNRKAPDGTIEEKVFYITRYFNFNTSSHLFEESKQEVIYQAK